MEREDGLPRIVIRRFADGEEHAIAFAEEAYSLGMSDGYEYDTESLRFTYSSMTTPRQVFDYNMRTRERVLRKTQEVPSGHNPADYVTRGFSRPHGMARRCRFPCSTIRTRRSTAPRPCLLYGYGSYGIAIPAGFSTNAFSLVDRGFVYAIAHIRGGKDKGYRWYKDGKLAKKTNTFKDFISAGRYLAESKFTSAGKIVGQGGSAGGMLMGAVANMAPELFAGHHRGRALRGRADDDARRHAAAHAAGMARMGQPHRKRRRLWRHRSLFALRQCARAGLSEHPRDRRPHRSARHLLGAVEMGGEASRA